MMTSILTSLALDLGNIGGEHLGPWGRIVEDEGIYPELAASAFARIISNIIGVMTIIAGIWFIFQFVIGGFGFMTAGGDPKKMGEARAKITSALIGLIIVVAAYAIIHLVGALLGLDILNPQDIIKYLSPVRRVG